MAQNQRPVTKTPTKPYGNSPKSLSSPVPAAPEELDPEILASAEAFVASQPNQPEGAVDPEIAASAEVVMEETPEPQTFTDQALAAGGQVLDAAGRVLDYPGGFARAALAGTAGALMGQTDVVSGEDLKKAAVGKGTEAAEYLRRLGVPEGGKLGDISTRGVAGFALDVATDPLTLLAKTAKAIPYVGKILNGTGKGAEALGEATYKSAVSKLDDKLARKGQGSLGDILVEQGSPILRQQQIADKVQTMSNVMGKVRQGLYDKATELGVSIDTAYPMKRAEAVLEKWEKNPGMRAAAGELKQLLDNYKGAGKVPIELMSEWKTSLYDSLPSTAFDAHGKLKGPAKQFKAALASDFRDAIVGAGNAAEKGLGDSINALNDKWGTLISAQEQIAKGNLGSNQGAIGKMIDGALLAGGGVSALAKKKAFDMAVSPYARQVVGRSLQEAGRHGIAQGVTNRAVINSSRPAAEEEE